MPTTRELSGTFSAGDAARVSRRLLVVEDESIIAMDIAEHLRAFGFSIVGIAGDSETALAMALEHRPHLILMDVMIKGPVDGIETAHRILAQFDVPVVFLTAYSDEKTLERAKAAAPYGYLVKPFREDELRAGIEVALYKFEIESKLRESEEQIRLLNESLEHKVRERTRELERSNAELAAFSYSVAHDLRTPLRGINGFSALLAAHYSDKKLDAAALDYLQRIQAASIRMGVIMDDLLALAHAGSAELRREDVDLGAMACEVVAGLRQGDPERRVEFVVAPGLRAQVDPALMRIALDNLLGNAWKFTARTEGAKIEFGLTTTEGKETYMVRDNGAGFDPAFSAKLFEQFQRLHTEKEYEGTGVGLAIVARVIRRHGGRIWAEGAVGQGAAFYFTLS